MTPWMAVEDVKAGLRMDCWEETPKASAPARKTTTERAVKRMFGAGVVGDGAIGDGAIVRVVRFGLEELNSIHRSQRGRQRVGWSQVAVAILAADIIQVRTVNKQVLVWFLLVPHVCLLVQLYM